MPELRQEYLDILERREWSVSGYTDDGRVELEWWSPAGEDFLVCVNVENFPDEILDYSDDFDPDEHIEMWVEARANGRQDVPGARRLAKDAEDIQKELDELGANACSFRVGDCVMGMTVHSFKNLMSVAARALRGGADNAGKE